MGLQDLVDQDSEDDDPEEDSSVPNCLRPVGALILCSVAVCRFAPCSQIDSHSRLQGPCALTLYATGMCPCSIGDFTANWYEAEQNMFFDPH